MSGKKNRCVLCESWANSCGHCKRKKAAAAAPPASCRQCRRSPCDCTAASSKRPRTAAPEATAQVRCASCSAWSNGCDDCRRQPPADPVPLAYCQTCKNTPCCKSACCQLNRIRSAPLQPRTPAPLGHVSLHSVEAGSTYQALFADDWLVPGRGGAGTGCCSRARHKETLLVKVLVAT